MGLSILITVIFFLAVILLLVSMLLFVKAKLTPPGKLKITINGDKVLEVNAGDTLLNTLSKEKIFLASACGGGGTCIQCTVKYMKVVEVFFLLKNHTFQEKKSKRIYVLVARLR